MKKVTILTILCFAFGVTAFAQGISIRPSFGFNATHLTNEGVEWNSTSQRIGYQFGVGLMVGEKFYFEPGIYWNTMSKDLYNVNAPEDVFKNTINSIRVPAVIGYHIIGDEDGIFDLRVFGGAGCSFVTGVKNDSDDLTKDDFKSMLFDLNAGIGIDLWIFFIEWHYLHGLTPVFVEGANDAKIQGFYGNLGIRIRL